VILPINYPASPDDDNSRVFFEEAFAGNLASIGDSESSNKVVSKPAFKSVKRSCDIPFEYWAILQTLVDLNDGAFTFTTALHYALRSFASDYFWDAVENPKFMSLYQTRLDERLCSENEALYQMLSNQQGETNSDV